VPFKGKWSGHKTSSAHIVAGSYIANRHATYVSRHSSAVTKVMGVAAQQI